MVSNLTAVEWLVQEISKNFDISGLYDEDITSSVQILNRLIEHAKAMERQQLFDAMMYALDEDGHTGEWKVKFINDYIDNL